MNEKTFSSLNQEYEGFRGLGGEERGRGGKGGREEEARERDCPRHGVLTFWMVDG